MLGIEPRLTPSASPADSSLLTAVAPCYAAFLPRIPSSFFLPKSAWLLFIADFFSGAIGESAIGPMVFPPALYRAAEMASSRAVRCSSALYWPTSFACMVASLFSFCFLLSIGDFSPTLRAYPPGTKLALGGSCSGRLPLDWPLSAFFAALRVLPVRLAHAALLSAKRSLALS